MDLLDRRLTSLMSAVLLSSCSAASDITAYEPLVGVVPVAVSLQTTHNIPLNGLPRLRITPIAHGVDAVWETGTMGCLIQSATAARAGTVIEITLERRGNPLADCAAVTIGERYAARVSGLDVGHFEVRFVDKFMDQPAHEIGRSVVIVSAYAPD